MTEVDLDGLELVAFGDESCKPVRDRASGRVQSDRRFYATAAMVSMRGDHDDLRTAIGDVASLLGRQLHYRRLSSQQKLEALAAISEIPGWEGFVYETASAFGSRVNEEHVRVKLLETALPHLCRKAGVTGVVLESRNTLSQGGETHDASDHRVLQRLLQRGDVPPATRLQHQGKEQTLLAIADLVAGARTDWLCAVTDEPFALVAHRMTAVVPVAIG